MLAGALALLGSVGLGALERIDASAKVRKRAEIAALLQMPARQQRRKAQQLGAPCGGLTGEQLLKVRANVLEHGVVAADAGNAGLDDQPAVDQLGEEFGLVDGYGSHLYRHGPASLPGRTSTRMD